MPVCTQRRRKQAYFRGSRGRRGTGVARAGGGRGSRPCEMLILLSEARPDDMVLKQAQLPEPTSQEWNDLMWESEEMSSQIMEPEIEEDSSCDLGKRFR
ncbi:hypothetical protein EVAR_28064_1 [Eumeta japonica]|uniref:Uncharacterized protein n=1 Tax=Eumeta variegata TaxID=151549 RepID=A0A4C1W8J5_EUMVA|nr:hypothetical protein EVAR_28064_1 [Eumeta japonica]